MSLNYKTPSGPKPASNSTIRVRVGVPAKKPASARESLQKAHDAVAAARKEAVFANLVEEYEAEIAKLNGENKKLAEQLAVEKNKASGLKGRLNKRTAELKDAEKENADNATKRATRTYVRVILSQAGYATASYVVAEQKTLEAVVKWWADLTTQDVESLTVMADPSDDEGGSATIVDPAETMIMPEEQDEDPKRSSFRAFTFLKAVNTTLKRKASDSALGEASKKQKA